jgi:hypothetical protein
MASTISKSMRKTDYTNINSRCNHRHPITAQALPLLMFEANNVSPFSKILRPSTIFLAHQSGLGDRAASH